MKIDKYAGLPVGVKRLTTISYEYDSIPTGKNGNNFAVKYYIAIIEFFNVKKHRPEYQAYVRLRDGSPYRAPLHFTRPCVSENNAIMAAMRWCNK